MGSNLINNKVSHIIEIEDDIIDLDEEENTPEEVIYEWDAKIRKKLSMFAVADNENILGDLMKEYLQSLQEIARNYEDNETLKNKVYCHISFLYSYYVELQCCTPDNYLSNMEDILSLYCSLELEVIRPLKKKDFSKHIYKKRIVSVSRRIIHVLTVYLLERHDHILHVLIKMNISNVTESCSEVLNVLYSHFLTKVPASSLCDESFCRSYIIFQKWKEVRKPEDWEGMDKIMYKMFKRTPESIKNNETLRQILMPACNSTVDIVFNLFRSFRDISSAYFKHIQAKKNTELDDLDFNIDLGEDEPTIAVDDENEEEVTFLKAYYEVERDMSNLSHTTNTSEITEIDIFRKCKQEFDEDDDVQFVGVTMLEQPPQRSIDLVIDYEESDEKVINTEESPHVEEERLPVPTPPILPNPTREKDPDLENLNGVTRIRAESPKLVIRSPSSSHSIEVQTALQPSSPVLCAIKEVISACDVFTETHQPKVSLVSNDTQVSSSSSPVKISDTLSDVDVNKRTKEMKSVEVQADNIKNYVYNDYGLTTPPFDVSTDEQISRPVEPRLYTDIGQSRKKESEKNVVEMKSVEVQVDSVSSNSSKECPYNDYGLTPPNDTHLEDHASRLQETCLYTNIGQKDLSEGKQNYANDSHDVAHNDEIPQLAQDNVEVDIGRHDHEMRKDRECENVEHASEYDEFEDHIDVSNVAHIDAECDTVDMDLESCHETDANSPLRQEESNSNLAAPEENYEDTLEFKNAEKESDQSFKTSDQIDTGQKLILNTAPNIETEAPESTHITETKELPETFNGNTILKPLVSSNRTNGQAKDVNTPSKIMYTSSQKIKTISLDDFSRFESAIHTAQWSKMKENHDFEDILSGPVSKIMPAKHTNLLSPQEKLDIFGSQDPNSKSMTNANSRSNSPNEMTSPAYEAIDDFRNYFSDSVNGRVPPPHDIKVPQSILKKSNSTRRKNYRIMFHESTCDNYEERRPRSDGVLVPKRVRRDRKLNMEPRVVVERLSFIESKMKKVLNNPPTLRVDYDKTTTHINEKDVVRCISPPRFSWILSTTSSRYNPGKVKILTDAHSKKMFSKCERNKSSCCNQLAEEFTKLNCNATEDKALNLTILDRPAPPIDPETEFSNSPTLPDTNEVVQHCLEETSLETSSSIVEHSTSLLCDNSNFYKSETDILGHTFNNVESSSNSLVQSSNESSLNVNETSDDNLLKLPTAVPESYDFEKNLKNEVFSKIDWQNFDDSDGETRLPLKKRKLSVANKNEAEDQKQEEISYPATPMISIAEVEALHPIKLQANSARPFKTPAERKEMPPLPVFYNVESEPSPIITDQFNINNHTYNNPTINYHMNNVPVPFINIPCGSYYSLPPILVPFNNVSAFDQSKLNPQQQEPYVKKEKKKQGRQRKRN